ncbi:tape measure protein [Microcystis phage vB_MweS-yong2]|nr:tape measure protein [Microcystis phage vB_MweS-yong2]
MANVIRAEAVITAQNRLRPGLTAAARDLERFRQAQAKAGPALAGMERMERMGGAIRAGLAGVAAGLGAGRVAEANKRFAEVDRAMTRIALTGDATADQAREGTTALRDMAREVALPFDQVREGMDKITASGREFADGLKMMPSVARTAQASGASVADIADSSTAMIDHMKISIQGLQEAQDTLAKGGQLGKFELKDMARYLPSMLPAFKAIGYEGQEGLRRLVAILQVIRGGTGTAEEAAASANNIFAKMESDATVKNFKDMGVDLPKAFAKARKEGRDLLSVFLDLSNKALKGDLSKLPQLFNDMEFARGMRALLTGQARIGQIQEQLRSAGGTIAENLKRVTGDGQAAIDRFKEAGDRATTAFGSLATILASPAMEQGAANLDRIAQSMERAAKAAREKGPAGATKQIVSDFVGQVAEDARRGREDFSEMAQVGRDDAALSGLAARRESRGDDPQAASAVKTLDYLRDLPQTPQRKAQMERLREFLRSRGKPAVEATPSELDAFGRDQLRRQFPDVPAGRIEMTGLAEDEAQRIRDAAREDRRHQAFQAATSQPLAAPGRKPRIRIGVPTPVERPADLDKGRVLIPPADLDATISKVGEVKAGVEGLGPAGQIAGSAMASGFLTSLQRMEAETDAAVARINQKLSQLKAPSLQFGGMGGLNGGRVMNEVR